MTKEEIQAQIDICKKLYRDVELADGSMKMLTPSMAIHRLEKELEQALSIKDLQEEAFNAGRDGIYIVEDNANIVDGSFTYRTFNDYLKTIENEK